LEYFNYIAEDYPYENIQILYEKCDVNTILNCCLFFEEKEGNDLLTKFPKLNFWLNDLKNDFNFFNLDRKNLLSSLFYNFHPVHQSMILNKFTAFDDIDYYFDHPENLPIIRFTHRFLSYIHEIFDNFLNSNFLLDNKDEFLKFCNDLIDFFEKKELNENDNELITIIEDYRWFNKVRLSLLSQIWNLLINNNYYNQEQLNDSNKNKFETILIFPQFFSFKTFIDLFIQFINSLFFSEEEKNWLPLNSFEIKYSFYKFSLDLKEKSKQYYSPIANESYFHSKISGYFYEWCKAVERGYKDQKTQKINDFWYMEMNKNIFSNYKMQFNFTENNYLSPLSQNSSFYENTGFVLTNFLDHLNNALSIYSKHEFFEKNDFKIFIFDLFEIYNTTSKEIEVDFNNIYQFLILSQSKNNSISPILNSHSSTPMSNTDKKITEILSARFQVFSTATKINQVRNISFFYLF
jgi:hypothetical protein